MLNTVEIILEVMPSPPSDVLALRDRLHDLRDARPPVAPSYFGLRKIIVAFATADVNETLASAGVFFCALNCVLAAPSRSLPSYRTRSEVSRFAHLTRRKTGKVGTIRSGGPEQKKRVTSAARKSCSSYSFIFCKPAHLQKFV
jgi:hypothetical protein